MALSAELKLRLETGEPLPKRLRLAENAYCSADFAINRKQDTILEWLCAQSRAGFAVWNSVKICLDCQGSNDRTTISRGTNTLVINAIIDKLKDFQVDRCLHDILDCCNSILLGSGMQQYFQTEINQLGLLLKHYFLKLKSALDSNAINGNSADIYVLDAIESLVKIHKQATDKDKLAETFLDDVLSPLCAFIDPNCKDNTNRIGAEAHKCMQQILFGKGRYTEYREYYKTKGGGVLPAKLFETVSKQAISIRSEHFPNMMNYVFRAAAGSYKADGLLIDRLFRDFVNFSGDYKTNVFNSLIQYLADIPLAYTNEDDDISLTQFLANLIDETLKKQNFTNEEYSLLRNITALNPLISEMKFQIIFKKILLMKRETEAEEGPYIQLMLCILDASSRLRREQKLVPWLLLALHEALRETKDCSSSAAQILPNKFTSEFNRFASRLNSSQIGPILSSLTFHLKSNCVDEYETNSKNHVSLMAECTVSLLVDFLQGIQILQPTVPSTIQQKFARISLGQLRDVLSSLAGKILSNEHNERMVVLLFRAVLSWTEVQSLLNQYVPQSGARDLSSPISDHDLKQLIQRVKDPADKDCTSILNRYLLHRLKINNVLSKPQGKLTGLIGRLEDSWTIILKNYPALVSSLDFDQLSELASLVLADIIAHGFEKWQETLLEETIQENTKFITAILCQALINIGLLIKGSASAAITARINPTAILENITRDAAVPALSQKKFIQDIAQWPNLSKEDSARIRKLLESLLGVPLSYLSVPLRTMAFVIIYVIMRELERDKRIKNLCEKILFDVLEHGSLNVFDFIEPKSLMPFLQESLVLRKAFAMSFRHMKVSTALNHLTSFDSCSVGAAPTVLSCTENLKPRMNTKQKVAIVKFEKRLAKKILSKEEKISKRVHKIQGLKVALRVAIGNNKVKNELENSILSTLKSTFVDEADDENKENLTDENEKSNEKGELIEEALELAAMALQNRTRLNMTEALISNIWAMVLKHPGTKILKPLIEATGLKVFKQISIELHRQTKIKLRKDDVDQLDITLRIWNCIFESDMGRARNKSRLNATRKLLYSLLMVDLNVKHWPDLIKLLLTFVAAKHIQPPTEYLDMIILTATRSLREGSLLVYNEVLVLCRALLRFRIEMMIDRLPMLLELYGLAISRIARKAKNDNTIDKDQLALCASNIEKVTLALVKEKRDVCRVSPYMIDHLITEFAEHDLQDVLKESFTKCFNSFMSICDSHGVSFLSRAPTSKREIFKASIEDYNKFHRFTGKI